MAKSTRSASTTAPRSAKTARKSPHLSAVPALEAPSHDDIARRAYELYVLRQGAEGDALGDWTRAESELLGGAAKAN